MSKRKRTLRVERLEDRQLMAVLGDIFGGLPTVNENAPAEEAPAGNISVVHEFPLRSLPGAPATLFLDFSGHFQEETFGDIAGVGGWDNILTPAFDRDGDATTFSPMEQQAIRFIWAAVAEDFAPFNINVTTVDPDPGNLHPERPYLRVVISGESDFTGNGAAGVAESDGFGDYDSYADGGDPNVVYVFNKNSSGQMLSIRALAHAASHEAGHAFGNNHFETAGDGFRAPIMAERVFSTEPERLTWSDDEQDEMARIASDDNGFGYRADDHVNGFWAPSHLIVSSAGLFGRGVIETMSDVDTFQFMTGGGNISIRLTVPTEKFNPFGAPVNIGNLDATLRLFNANGTLIAEDTDPTLLAGLTANNLPAGTYYVQVGSFGQYGDVGQYSFLVNEDRGARIVSSSYHSTTSTTAALLVTFNEPINPNTFTIYDVRINGGASGAGVVFVTEVIGTNAKTFLIQFNKPTTVTAWWSLSIGPNIADSFGNAMDQNSNGLKGEAVDYFMASFLGDGPATNDPGTAKPPKVKTINLMPAQWVDATFQTYR